MLGRRRFIELISGLVVSLRTRLAASSACPLGYQAAQGTLGGGDFRLRFNCRPCRIPAVGIPAVRHPQWGICAP
jgi:hypothetical protein